VLFNAVGELDICFCLHVRTVWLFMQFTIDCYLYIYIATTKDQKNWVTKHHHPGSTYTRPKHAGVTRATNRSGSDI